MTRKHWISVFGVVTWIVLVTSTAYACTTWQGKMTLTGSGSSPGSVSAMGRNFSMAYCSSGAPSGTAGMAASTSATVTITIAASSSGCNSTTLPNGTYDIRWTTGTWDPQTPGTNDCMDTTTAGTMSVTSGAGGPTASSSFNPGSAGTIQVCVTKGTYAMQVPVSVA